jgi:acyl-CoA thioester hydrolase
MLVYDYKIRVRYGETDMMGYLYYGNYFQLYEIGRTETMRSVGIIYSEMESIHGIMLPVIEVNARYLLPAKYDEELTIRSILRAMPTKMITVENEIYNQNQQLIHQATVKLFFVDMKNNQRVSCPSYITEVLKPFF